MPQFSAQAWLVAEALIAEHGAEAAVRAWEAVQEMRSRNRLEEVLFWMAVTTAILEWQRREPIGEETVH